MTDADLSGHANWVESSLDVTEKSPIPDSRYCFKIVVFQVGNSIFRVPTNGFEIIGTPFESMFSLPIGDVGSQPEGSCDANPIILQVDENYFRGFLGAMYPYHAHTMTSEDWIGALDLATMWMFQGIRDKAIEQLAGYVQERSPKEAALLAKKYRVLDWLKDAYLRLLQQSTLTTADLTADPALDWETIGRLFAIRSQSVTSTQGSAPKKNVYRSTTRAPLNELMDNEFYQEFSRMVPGPASDQSLPVIPPEITVTECSDDEKPDTFAWF